MWQQQTLLEPRVTRSRKGDAAYGVHGRDMSKL